MKKILKGSTEYEIIEEYKDGFIEDEFISKLTDYYDEYDYVVGDWAYGKLRLKGFYEKNNKKCKVYNCINDLKKYLKDNCAYDCKYFIAKKVYKK